MKNKIFWFLLLLSLTAAAQQENAKWEKKPDPYLSSGDSDIREYNFSGNTVSSFLVNSSISLYWFFISDQDGDNCPFYPSCSHFFVESVKQTDLFRGILMFGDRFTRDMNIINREKKYPIVIHRRLYDPPELYTLENIIYPPPVK